ncbi:MAG TPA: IPT/TIG domain-containing protein [Paludibaculum sp.]
MTRRLLALLVLCAALAPAYYHFTRFQTRNAPYVPVFDRFDVSALPNKTVSFFVSEQGPTQLAPGDSFPALLSQLRAAAKVWNGVESSDLRLNFGGVHTPGTMMNTPWIEVEFTDELPPGVLAQGGPVARLDPIGSATGTFTPIAKSLLRLPRNLSARPSYTERLFLTMVHEFGHTLGLQHSWSSGVMSTEITRATSKAKPLAADDIAGISILYPTTNFSQQTGTVSGRVAVAGAGVNLASVVAISPSRAAVSTLTNPDGTYTLQGLPAGLYYIYAHALPPSLPGEPQPVNLELPADPTGSLTPGSAFDLVFYPGTATPQSSVSVSAGQTTANINFAGNRRASVNVHSAQTYSFYRQEAVKPATFVLGSASSTAVLTGYSLTAPSAGLNISVAGDTESVNGIRQYSAGYLAVDIALSPFSAVGPRHLLFTVNNESYLLPSALTVVAKTPPSLQTVTQNGDRTFTATGSNLTSATQVWVDGVAAKVISAQDGQMTLALPPASVGYRGVMTAYNPDGQSNLFLQGAATPVHVYDTADVPQLSTTPNNLPAGVETVIELTGVDFDSWAPSLSFGSSDISIRQIWPISSTRALAQVLISPFAQTGPINQTVSQGIVVNTTPAGFQVLPNSRPVYLALSLLPKGPIYAGSIVTLPVVNAQPGTQLSSFHLTIGDRPSLIVGFQNGQLTVQIPSGLTSGPALVQMSVDGVSALPAVIVLDVPPPIILGAQTVNGAPLTVARPGDSIQLIVASLTDNGSIPDASRLHVTSGAVEHAVQSVLANPQQPGTQIVQISITAPAQSASALALTLSIDGRSSSAFGLPYLP